MTKYLPEPCRCRIVERWCGNYVTQEDGFCNDCRMHCTQARIDMLEDEIECRKSDHSTLNI